ncbi:MAG: cytochrome P450 [Thermoleophilaceae bacterium]
MRSAPFPIGASATVAELERDPHPLLARLREAEPVSWLPALDAWLVTRRDLALEVMRESDRFTVDDERFSTGRVVGPSMLTLDGAEHDRHRAPFAPPFRLAPVHERFAEVVATETEKLLDSIELRGRAELRRDFAGPLAATVVTHALGLAETDVSAVLGWYDAIVESVSGVAAGRAPSDAGHSAFAELGETIEAMLDRPSLVASASGQGLARGEVVSNAAVLLFGGIETTAGMIVNALMHLLTNRDQLALVASSPALVAGAVEESLRLEPAAATIDRYATADVSLGGASIPRGDLVTISIAAANRDPASFDDPDRFYVRRSNARQHIAFAHGPHVCIGMHLARLEAHTALERVLARLPRLRLADGAMPAARGLVFRKPPALECAWG